MDAREGYTTNFNKTNYFATDGIVKLALKPLKPLVSDTLFVGYVVGNVIHFQDSFIATAPYYWKKVRGKTGAGKGLYWCKGRNQYNKSLNLE